MDGVTTAEDANDDAAKAPKSTPQKRGGPRRERGVQLVAAGDGHDEVEAARSQGRAKPKAVGEAAKHLFDEDESPWKRTPFKGGSSHYKGRSRLGRSGLAPADEEEYESLRSPESYHETATATATPTESDDSFIHARPQEEHEANVFKYTHSAISNQ